MKVNIQTMFTLTMNMDSIYRTDQLVSNWSISLLIT